jgi:outer membrane lipoprotein-sorting protein
MLPAVLLMLLMFNGTCTAAAAKPHPTLSKHTQASYDAAGSVAATSHVTVSWYLPALLLRLLAVTMT